MHKRITSFIYLLPLVILISLPCSVKQDLKQLFGIPVNTSVQIEKSGNTICVYTSVQSKKNEKKKQQFNVKHLFKQASSFFSLSTDLTLYQSTGSDPSNFSPVPIFLRCRKLII
ncbi:hypothetical protein [Dysgonomonas sp. BGC7]|uniref:hypothetical protein n=1 Tax=Dysgonomonas sp. BGC7 TaxID=1658008 RepID=UPI000681A67D|nr:hypothetical protein [Dysgonomonas sp. BGC7]MBD8389125.1 hypothetical protein [Dysgonomonas sp. BGC7]